MMGIIIVLLLTIAVMYYIKCVYGSSMFQKQDDMYKRHELNMITLIIMIMYIFTSMSIVSMDARVRQNIALLEHGVHESQLKIQD